MFGRTRFQNVSGTRCLVDFVELPSVLFENFANDYRVVSQFARHLDTGEVLPQSLWEECCASQNHFPGMDMEILLVFALMDQRFHGPNPTGKTTTEIMEEIYSKYC